jgi:hypothetical protein
VIAAVIAIVIQTDEIDRFTNTMPETTKVEVVVSETSSPDPIESWLKLGETENSLAQSELSELEYGLFGLMAAPGLRLFKFAESGWQDVTDEYGRNFDIPSDRLDYDITIQSLRVTDDDAFDFVVNYRVAPWDVLKADNQGRDFGTVLSGQGGLWGSVKFIDPYGDGKAYTSVEHIEFFNDVLFGSGYGSCGRPCGLLVYQWLPALNQLEGKEASPLQKNAFNSQLSCASFNFNESFPLGLCQEGEAIRLVQQVLVDSGYPVEVDGNFGKDSEFALKIFQRKNGIRAIGQVDEATWKLMFDGVGLPGNDLNGDGFVGPNELSGG